MNRLKIASIFVVIAIIGTTTFYVYRSEQKHQTADTCPFCDRMVHSITAFRLTVDHHEVAACCPRCGMHAMLNHEQGTTTKAWATDVDTGEKIAAQSATYVEGGDVRYCVHDDQPAPREPSGASVREFDRCLPTLVAFKNAQEAGDYQHQHGGRVLTYAQALASVREQ